jgi:hypothetical protein
MVARSPELRKSQKKQRDATVAVKSFGKTQAEQLQHFRDLLGEQMFQRVQDKVWKRFSLKAAPIGPDGALTPLALFGVWGELHDAMREAVKRQGHEKEFASRAKPVNGPIWELLKNGVTWSASLHFRRDHRDWEVVIKRNGQCDRVERFATRERADTWADKQCVEITAGWKT